MKIRVLISFGCCYLIAASSQPFAWKNTPPEVEITRPFKNSTVSWNSLVPYSIDVIDLEDGNSQYGEISNNEVLLSVKYLEDSLMVPKYLSDHSKKSHQPLLWISTAGCFNCHDANQNLIGPSFTQIAGQYANQEHAMDLLTSKVIQGSTGNWGDLQMPPHPQLERENVRQMVLWIITNNLDPDQKYMAGITGTFRTKAKPDSTTGKAVYVLTASYTDNGWNGQPQTVKEGRHSMVLKIDN